MAPGLRRRIPAREELVAGEGRNSYRERVGTPRPYSSCSRSHPGSFYGTCCQARELDTLRVCSQLASWSRKNDAHSLELEGNSSPIHRPVLFSTCTHAHPCAAGKANPREAGRTTASFSVEVGGSLNGGGLWRECRANGEERR